jgi:hypothetical protein
MGYTSWTGFEQYSVALIGAVMFFIFKVWTGKMHSEVLTGV